MGWLERWEGRHRTTQKAGEWGLPERRCWHFHKHVWKRPAGREVRNKRQPRKEWADSL